MEMKTPNMADENFKKLIEIFPNIVTETIDENGNVIRAINKEMLEQEISIKVVDGPKERYQFTWPEKKQSILAANAPTTNTLRPSVEDSVNFDTTKNLYIEGDNLEVLKILQETYLGKVKMIYIDPPYNTGKDFVYNDDFSEDINEYMEKSSQFDEEGNRLFINTESNGRFHTDWLNMMYPRLKMARNLLSEDGVIFISIDDNEQANLKKICDEIFGEGNFITNFVRKGTGGRQDSKYYAITHEYMLCYSKDRNFFESGKELNSNVNYPFFDEERKLKYKTQLLRKWGENSKRTDRPNLFYPIIDPDGNKNYPMLPNNIEGCWRWGKDTMESNIKEGKVEFKWKDGEWIAYEKVFESLDGDRKLYNSIIDDISNKSGSKLLKDLMDNKIFDYPKPMLYLKKYLKWEI